MHFPIENGENFISAYDSVRNLDKIINNHIQLYLS